MSGRLVGWMKEGERLDATLGDEARIGSADNSDVVVAVKGVSRAQARIVRDGSGYWIEDAGSKNGTLVNGVAVVRSALHHLDVVSLGRVVDLVFVNRGDVQTAPDAPLAVSLERLEGSLPPIQIPAGVLTIGRAEDAGLTIDSNMASRNHARISNSGNKVTLEDLNSANGTSINGRRINAPTLLRDGDVFEIGDSKFRIRMKPSAPAPRPAATQPAIDAVDPPAIESPKADQEWKTRIVFLGDVVDEMPSALRRPAATISATPATATAAITPAPVAPAAPAAPRTAFVTPDVLIAPNLGGRTVAPAPPVEPPVPAAGPRTIFGGSLDLDMPAGLALGAPEPLAETMAPATMRMDAPPVQIRGVRLRGPAGTFMLNPGLSKVGRAPDSQVLLNDRDVSRWHASITVDRDSVVVEDRNSANGTQVDGTPISTPTRLESGSTVAFGQVEFSVEVLRQ